jgi:hypothetical protein
MDGRPVRTRTADLYRVKGPLLRTPNSVNNVGDRLSTWKHGQNGIVTGEITGEDSRVDLGSLDQRFGEWASPTLVLLYP